MTTYLKFFIGVVSLVLAVGVLLYASGEKTPTVLQEALQPKKDEVTILFGGDMMFDRYIRKVSETKGQDYLFSCIDDVLKGKDLVVANLEGPITSNPSLNRDIPPESPELYTFTFPTTTAELLYRHNIHLVNIGNNHIANFSRGGMVETKKWLDKAGVQYVGDPMVGEIEKVARLELKGIPISFVNWSDWTSDKTDYTAQQVVKEKKAARIVFVYTHWGNEYVAPPEMVKRLAHQFVDGGASVIIGSHPHIVQEHEKYNGADIFYSLGNFIFDQYWNVEVSHGLMVEVTLTKEGVQKIKEIPIRLEKDGRTCPV